MMKRKRFGRKRQWPNFKVLCRHLPGGTEENHGKRPSEYPVTGFEN
jgi:hypothetical protein